MLVTRTTIPAAPLARKPVHEIYHLRPFLKTFYLIVANKVISVSGSSCPVIFFDISNPRSHWRIRVKP